MQRIGALSLAVVLSVSLAEASFIISPTLGNRDTSMSGNTVAVPSDAGSILFHNAAGIMLGEAIPELNVSAMFFSPSFRYENPQISYGGKSDEKPLVPVLWAGRFGLGDWRLGAGVYGAVGTAFNFQADPAAGIPNRFLSQLTTLDLGLVAGRTILPGLDLGLQIAPVWGELRFRSPSPVGPISFNVDGFGVVGSLGLLYHADERTTLGVSYRSPNTVFMSGDARVGDSPDEVDFDLHIPQLVGFGVAREVMDGLVLTAQARWADYPEFENGGLEFDQNPAFDRKPISSARAGFRYGAALEWALKPTLRFRAGVAREPWMMEEETVSPLLVDFTEIVYHVGVGIDVDEWTLDFEVGSGVAEDRVVTADANPAFPGRYALKPGVAGGFAITYRFATGGRDI